MDTTARPVAFSLEHAPDRLAWIFGSSRSGSSWLLCMLPSLDGVASIDDPHLGHHLGVRRPISLAWATAEYPPDLTTLDRVKHDKDSYAAVPRADKGDDKQIRSATPGAWRDNLTAAEHDVMHEVMGAKLAEFGYLEPTPVGLA
jgi:hypothetical protein